MQRKVFEDLTAPFLIRISKSGARNVAAKACVIQLRALAMQTSNNVAQT